MDASTSPFTPNIIAHTTTAVPSTNSLRRSPRNLQFASPVPRISPHTPVSAPRNLRLKSHVVSNDIQTPVPAPRILSSVSRAVSNAIQTPVFSSVLTRVERHTPPPAPRLLRSASRAWDGNRKPTIHVASPEVGMANVRTFVSSI